MVFPKAVALAFAVCRLLFGFWLLLFLGLAGVRRSDCCGADLFYPSNPSNPRRLFTVEPRAAVVGPVISTGPMKPLLTLLHGRRETAVSLAAVVVLVSSCATTGSTFRSGVGDAYLTSPPYYAGTRVSVDAVSRIAHLPQTG